MTSPCPDSGAAGPASSGGVSREQARPQLPRAEFAFPGPLRDRIVAAVLGGAKTATSSLLREYEQEHEPLPATGDRSVVVDSGGLPVAVIEVTRVRVVPLGDVDDDHARDEGEGHTTAAEWRRAHEEFWHSEAMRAALGEPPFAADDSTPVVLEQFRVVETLRPR